MRKLSIPREFLGAFKAGHRKASRPFIDEELAYQLLRSWMLDGCEEARKHLEWLSKFNNEYHKAVVKKGDRSAFHNTDALRKDCDDRANARRRDVYSTMIRMNLNEGF